MRESRQLQGGIQLAPQTNAHTNLELIYSISERSTYTNEQRGQSHGPSLAGKLVSSAQPHDLRLDSLSIGLHTRGLQINEALLLQLRCLSIQYATANERLSI